MQKLKRRALTVGAAIALGVASGAAPASASTNQAPTFTPSNAPVGTLAVCGWSPGSNGLGGATVTTSIPLRNGPGQSCGNVSNYLNVGQRLGGWCRFQNSAGNWWYYVSVGGAAPYGWIYGGNVSGESTITTPCTG
ncbi:hypothetical protein AB0A95_25055 [Micromonospora sp. NPDC049230]|uniref:hypothetical protein n=1 Tax=Micromonospora sp. NPDC049230 TaxID=3155502 RepID=UPI0033D4966D